MVIKSKEGLSRKNITDFVFICVLAFVIVFGMGFVNAIVTSVMDLANEDPAAIGAVNYSRFSGLTVTEDNGHIYNITINQTSNAAVGAHNVTNVTIYFWGNFDFASGGEFYASTYLTANNNLTGNLTGTADGAHGPYPYFSNSTAGGWIQWNATNTSSWLYAANDSTLTNTSWFFFNATAVTPGKYNITVRVGYNWSGLYNETNITIHVNDTTKPWKVNATMYLGGIGTSYNSSISTSAGPTHLNMSGTVTLNISAIDNGNLTAGGREYDITGINVTFFNKTGCSNGSFMATNVTNHFWNVSIDTTVMTDGLYNITIIVNDTRNNFNITNISNVRVDNTAPTGTMTCSPVDAYVSSAVTCSCSGSDNLAGVDTTTYTSSPSTANAGTDLTQTCTVVDMAGNTGTITSNKYTIWGSPSGGSSTTTSGSSSTTTAEVPVGTTSVISQITPSSPTTITSFSSSSGVKEIQIKVTDIVSNVKLTVNEYTSSPTGVPDYSVSLGRPAYKYLNVDTQNLEDHLREAVLTFKVEKDWVEEENLELDWISFYRYLESVAKSCDSSQSECNVWEEVETTYDSEDNDYFYFKAYLDGFSTFVIGSKEGAVVDSGATTGEPETSEGMNLTWLWIVIGIIVVASIIGGIALKKKKK